MALSKVNFNSLNVTPSASKALKFNSSNNGLETGDVGGSLVLISTVTASSSSTIDFTSGIDSTYKEYQVHFINCHPATDGANFTFNASTDSGSNYNVTATTTLFQSYHDEADSTAAVSYSSTHDHAQDTGYKKLGIAFDNDNDSCGSGYLHLFNPSSTTFVKHYLGIMQVAQNSAFSQAEHYAGYFNTTSAIDAIQFKFSSGNIDAGTFKLYGVL
tara:strand:+ start:1053 stop:1697 length:645 start_codon:yes stop_codon:yes gene_type:complete